MDAALAPFQQYLATAGAPPAQTVQTLLQTASTLQMGAPAQKAQMVASLIEQFGVDIHALDSILAHGKPPAEVQQSSQLDQLLNEKLAPYQQYMQTIQAQQAQQNQARQAEINNELNTFASQNEFYNDVRPMMATLLDTAAKDNIDMSLQDAYDTDCHMNPQIRQILQTRQATPTPQKQRAASSIRGNPGGGGGTPQPNSLRETIEQAWEMTGRT